MKAIAHEFATWCHRVGELSPRPITMLVWICHNYPDQIEQFILMWAEFIRVWTTHRRLA